MSLLLLIVILVLLFGGVGAYPNWGYSRDWGYGPSGILGVLLVIVVVMALLGHQPF